MSSNSKSMTHGKRRLHREGDKNILSLLTENLLGTIIMLSRSPNVNVPPKCVSKPIQMEALLLLLI